MNGDDHLQIPLPTEEADYYQTYFRRIESLFATLRGRAILLSPKDYQLAKGWYEKGIPLSCILRGIRQAFYKKMAEDDYDEDAILSLNWCKWAVMDEWKSYRKRSEAEEREVAEESLTGDETEAVLSSLVYDLLHAASELDSERYSGLSIPLTETAEKIRTLTDLDEEKLEVELQRLEDELLNTAWNNLPAAEQKRIESSVRRSIKKRASHLDEEELEETIITARQEKLQRDLRIPRMSLYTL